MTAPMFSIIVPTLNAAATLGACLDSVVGQTCSDFEVVLVDGGSTDGTLDIANGFAPTLGTRLVIHCGPDQGIYDAMNRGVGMATGAWLLFLGADDTLFEADTLARVAAFIGEHEPSDLVYGDVIFCSTSSRHAGVFDLDRLLFEQNMCHQSIFYRRELSPVSVPTTCVTQSGPIGISISAASPTRHLSPATCTSSLPATTTSPGLVRGRGRTRSSGSGCRASFGRRPRRRLAECWRF